MREDTIAAIATAAGEGGIGIVRISGEKAIEILQKVFIPAGKFPDKQKLAYGHVMDPATGKAIDEVMAVYMKDPHSYTAEDVAEIQCHGGIVPLRKILELVLRNGARMAERGEFTKRAFLNGRLDLSQAEAVADLVKARTDRSFDVALDQLEGKLSQKIRQIRQELVDVLVNLTVNIDYPDEDIEEMTYEKLAGALDSVSGKLAELLKTADTGRIIREGLKVSIVGKPNVGKSSLMNALTGENRAIVTDIPGTTRDTIEESVTVRGIPIVLTDTAGIHDTEDVIEQIGIERSKKAFNNADLVILVVDGSQPLDAQDCQIMEYMAGRRSLCLINKRDKGAEIGAEEIAAKIPEATILESTLTEGKGVEALLDTIEKMVYGGKAYVQESLMVTNTRHKMLLEQGAESIGDAITLTEERQPLEFIEIDVNSCYESLGEIIGETASDIIDQVFERFCLGK